MKHHPFCNSKCIHYPEPCDCGGIEKVKKDLKALKESPPENLTHLQLSCIEIYEDFLNKNGPVSKRQS